MNLPDGMDSKVEQHEVHRLGPPFQEGNHLIGVSPVSQHLVGRPETAAANGAPVDVVPGLAPEEESGVALKQPALVELVADFLCLLDIKP